MEPALLLAVLVLVALLASRPLYRSLQLRWRFARGAKAEQRAVELARSAGYRVVATQVPGRVVVRVDGQARTADVRADMLLERGFRRFIAEVKSGRVAPDPTSRATRRQLLEYAHAFDADGLLLFDMQKDRIHEIRFDRPMRAGRALWWLMVLAGSAAVGVWIEHGFHLVSRLR